MHNNWCLEIWGDYACFTRPELKVERVSYDLITPSAARAIFESILWKPAMRWHITSIEVLNPIKWVSVRRNEVGKTILLPTSSQLAKAKNKTMGIYIEDERQQKAGLFLKDVRYRIHGYFDFISPGKQVGNRPDSSDRWTDNKEIKDNKSANETEAKYAAIFERRVKKGQCFHRPYLGCREFACDFKLVDPKNEQAKPIAETRDLGFMLYDFDFEEDRNKPTPLFFYARLKQGVVNTDRRTTEVRR